DFVPVILLRRADYLKVKPKIHDVPGTVFHTGTSLLGPTPQFAKLLLGRVGPATADALKQLGPGYLESDAVGTSGLQAAYNRQLTGRAGVTIRAGSTVVGRIAPVPGKPLATTLDIATQNAADKALANVPQHASVVALRASTGQLLAVANSPST